MLFLLPAVLLAAPLAQALIPPSARVTDPIKDQSYTGVSPRTTEAPKIHALELMKRATSSSYTGYEYFAPDNTCGYVNGVLGAIFTCDPGSTCVGVRVSTIGNVGCCGSGNCDFYADCVGLAQYSNSSVCDHACQLDTQTVKCTKSTAPYCYPYYMPGLSISFFGCDSTKPSTYDTVLTTFKGGIARVWSTSVFDQDQITGTSSKATTSAILDAFTSATKTSARGAAASAASSSVSGSFTTMTASSSTGTPIGAIVGGIVGGLILIIAAICVGILICFFRRRKRRMTAQGATGPVGPTNNEMTGTFQHQAAPGAYVAPVAAAAAAGGGGVGYYGAQEMKPSNTDSMYKPNGPTITETPIAYAHNADQNGTMSPTPGSPAPPYNNNNNMSMYSQHNAQELSSQRPVSEMPYNPVSNATSPAISQSPPNMAYQQQAYEMPGSGQYQAYTPSSAQPYSHHRGPIYEAPNAHERGL